LTYKYFFGILIFICSILNSSGKTFVDKISFFLTKISFFDQNFIVWPKFHFFDQNFIVWPKFYFWPKFHCLTKISLFDQNLLFWPKFHFLTNISFFLTNISFLTKISFYDQNFIYWPKFHFMTKISFYDQNFIFWPIFHFWPKFHLLTNISFCCPIFHFLTKISNFDQKITFFDQHFDLFKKFCFLTKISIFYEISFFFDQNFEFWSKFFTCGLARESLELDPLLSWVLTDLITGPVLFLISSETFLTSFFETFQLVFAKFLTTFDAWTVRSPTVEVTTDKLWEEFERPSEIRFLKYSWKNIEICEHSNFFNYWTKIFLWWPWKFDFLFILVGYI